MTCKRIILKFGTSTLTDVKHSLSRRQMLELARQVSLLHERGHETVVVTSGAVAAGREVIEDRSLNATLSGKQMLAAVGQVRLMHAWSEFFGAYDAHVGQVLLTRSDLANRSHYLNIRDTMLAMLSNRVIPIVNENDTVATKRLRFGDNDNLAALVANLVDADLLVLVTDQEGLFTADPRRDPQAKLISVVEHIDEAIESAAKGAVTKVGTGGMMTKVQAARLAVESGTEVRIVSGKEHDVLLRVVGGASIGTRFPARETPLESRKRWLVSERVQGRILVDEGAVASLTQKGSSLLPVGIKEVHGTFDRGATVEVATTDGNGVAVGISGYSSDELAQIRGIRSSEIEQTLGYSYGAEVIHRDNLALKKRYGRAS